MGVWPEWRQAWVSILLGVGPIALDLPKSHLDDQADDSMYEVLVDNATQGTNNASAGSQGSTM
jgi:hypothetical protein